MRERATDVRVPARARALLAAPRARVLSELVLIFGLAAAGSHAAGSPGTARGWGSWRDVGAVTPRADPAVVAGAAGLLYVVGGNVSQMTMPIARADLDAFAPATGVATGRAAMPTARWGHGAALAGNGRLYVVGGTAGPGALAVVEEYQPATDSWTRRAPMPTARSRVALVATDAGRLLALGGDAGGGPATAVEEYDPSTDTWTAKAPMPRPGGAVGAARVGDRVYAVGGGLGAVAEYDPGTDAWRTRASAPTGLPGFNAVAAPGDGRVYAVERDAIHAYDPASDSWTAYTGTGFSSPDPRHPVSGFGVGAAGGRLYAVGGGYFCLVPGECAGRGAQVCCELFVGTVREAAPLEVRARLPLAIRAASP